MLLRVFETIRTAACVGMQSKLQRVVAHRNPPQVYAAFLRLLCLVLSPPSLPRVALLPCQLPELLLDLVLEVIKGRGSSAWIPISASSFIYATARGQRTSSSVRRVHGRQAVDPAVYVDDGAVERWAADKLQESCQYEYIRISCAKRSSIAGRARWRTFATAQACAIC